MLKSTEEATATAGSVPGQRGSAAEEQPATPRAVGAQASGVLTGDAITDGTLDIPARSGETAGHRQQDDGAFALPPAPVPHGIVATAVAAADTVIVVVCALLASALTGAGGVLRDETILVTTSLGIGLLIWLGAYTHRTMFSASRQVHAIVSGGAGAAGIVAFVETVFGLSHQVDARWAIAWAGLSFVGLVSARVSLAAVLKSDRQGRYALRTVIVGGGPHGARLVQFLRLRNDRSLKLLGFVDDRVTRIGVEMGAIPYFGPIDEVFSMVRAGMVDKVIVALPWSAEERMLQLLRQLAEYPVHVRLAPDLITYHFPGRVLSDVGGVPLLHLLDRPISGWGYLIKRAEDLAIAGTALLVLGIPMLLIALAVRLDSPGPILFRQPRIGFNNRPFEVLKFRTMYAHMSERRISEQAKRDDPRITRVGRVLRRLSLDELPQLFNVLRGDMSVVGPRPHAPQTRAAGRPFEEVVARYAARHRVKPGMTGLAQVRGWRGETDTEEKIIRRVESDLEYVENWSVWLDAAILVRTLLMVLRMKNAY
ncbi:undecaprenyl-phosphate glucose phosphotransferase [Elioraea rosea]|uniref:undecaprenyl-phosphate glucose phosphotransferase n=1 Tax=Elioraea rosea TaxID=2492390 RepID=UPI0013155D78|nr:undecaprenyl-phosphate glucose phosphotransferase [Elioraea rosea]